MKTMLQEFIVFLGGLLLLSCHCGCSISSQPGIYVIDENNGILKMSTTGDHPTYVVNRTGARLFSIAHDPIRDCIYWTEREPVGIGRLTLATNQTDFLPLPNTVDPRGLAIDYISNLLYMTDDANKNILIIDFDNQTNMTLLNLNHYPPALVVDPEDGWMYWSDFGTGISRAKMNGTGQQLLSNNKKSHGLAIDKPAGRLYFCDNESVQSMSLDGSNRITHFRGIFSAYGSSGIAMDKQDIYVTTSFDSSVLKISKFANESNRHTTVYNSSCKHCRFDGIIFVNSSFHQTVNNSCSLNNGGCNYFCLPVPNGRACACPDDNPQCQKLRECPNVSNPGNGNVTYIRGNSTLLYTCNAGYTLQGTRARLCQSNGLWTPGSATCNLNCSGASQTLSVCQSSVVSGDLRSISQVNITEQNAEEVAINVSTKLRQTPPQNLQPQDINSLSTTLENLAHVRNVDSKSFVGIVSNVLSTNTSALQGSQQEWNSSARILHALDDHAVNVDLGPSGKTTTVQSNVAFAVWNATNLDALPVAYGTGQDSQMPFAEDNVLAYKNSSQVNIAETNAGILLSDEVLQLITSAQGQGQKPKRPIRVSFSIFRKGDLFVAPSNGSGGRQVVIESMVVAATVHNVDTRNLNQPIKIILKTNQKKALDKPICAYWDFTAAGGQGNWSTEGCFYNGTKDGRVICYCYHLTNFAIIGGFNQLIGDGHKTALSIISIIGLSLSLTGLLFTILTYLGFRQFRKNRGQKVLFNLAISLFAVNVTFLAGIAATKNKNACRAVAALLQYFLLVSFAWMLVEGVLQYLKLVKVLDTYIPRFMFKASLSAWGIPLIPVAVVAAINHELFLASGKVEYCWLSPLAFYYAFLLPMGLVMIVNIVLFSLVIRSFTCNKSKVQSSLPDWELAKMQFNAAVICFILLGFTWIFAFISLVSDHLVFQYLFCICNAFQGFFIFIFCNIRDPAVHRAWLQFFRFGTTREKWIGLSSTEQGRTATSRL